MDILSLCRGRCSLLVVVTLMLLATRGHRGVSEAYLLSQCECGGEEKCACSGTAPPPPSDSGCNATRRVVRHCKEYPGLASDKARSARTLPAGCTAIGHVQNIVAKYSVNGDQQSLYLSWDPPTRVDLSLGYEVMLATQISSVAEIMTRCASVLVPPCVYRINVLKGSHSGNWTGQHYLSQCLRGLIHATKDVHIAARFISYPIAGSFFDAETQAPSALIKVPSCVEIAKESVLKLTELCKIKLTYLPPKVENATFQVTTLPNNSYLITWEINSALPLASAVLLVLQGYNGTMSDARLPENENRRGDLLASKTFDSPTTGKPMMSFTLVLKDAPPRDAVASVQMSLKIDQNAAITVLLNDTAYLEALEDDLDLEKDTITLARARERAMAFVGELSEDKDSTVKKLSLTVDGGWSRWRSAGPCPACDVLPRLNQTRTCTAPAPSLYGKGCEGPSQQSPVCMAPCYRQSNNENTAPASGETEKAWFRRPVFYATMAAVLGIAVLIVIFIKRSPWKRSRKPAPRPVDGTRDIEQFTARPFTPPTYQGSHKEEKPDFNPPVLDVRRPQSPDSIVSCDSTDSLISVHSDAVRPRPSPQPPRTAYVSYSRAGESHARNVLEFVDWLAYYNVAPLLDQYDAEHFCHDMHGWIENRVSGADWVLVVLSSDYFNAWHGNEAAADEDLDGGPEVRLEARLIKGMLAQAGNRVVPVFLGNYYGRSAIPALLEGNKAFRVAEDDPRQACALLSHLHGVEEYSRPVF